MGLASVRAVLGLGEAAFYPAAIAGMSAWFPPKDRAKAVGLLLSALSVGTLVAVPVVAWIAVHHGWRASFLATGAVGFLLLPPWRMLHLRARADRDSVCVEAGKNRGTGARIPLKFVLRTRKYWCTLAARGCSDAAWYFYLFWMPGYFQEARGLSLETVGRLLWIPYFAAGVGALAGAWLSSLLMHRGFSLDRARKIVLLPSAALGALGGLSYFAADYTVGIAILAVALLGHQSWSSNLHTAISEICSARTRGTPLWDDRCGRNPDGRGGAVGDRPHRRCRWISVSVRGCGPDLRRRRSSGCGGWQD